MRNRRLRIEVYPKPSAAPNLDLRLLSFNCVAAGIQPAVTYEYTLLWPHPLAALLKLKILGLKGPRGFGKKGLSLLRGSMMNFRGLSLFWLHPLAALLKLKILGLKGPRGFGKRGPVPFKGEYDEFRGLSLLSKV